MKSISTKYFLLSIVVTFFFCSKSYANVFSETEPNDTASYANEIQYGDTVLAAVVPEGDKDYYRFYAEAGDTVEIFASERNGSGLYGKLILFNEYGNHLQTNYQYTYNPNTNKIQCIIYENGIYYIRYSYQGIYDDFPSSPPHQESAILMRNKVVSDSPDKSSSSGDYIIILNKFFPSAPAVSNIWPSNNKYSSIRLNGEIFTNGLQTTIEFEYGMTPSYGNAVSPSPDTANVLNGFYTYVDLVGLQPSTTYYFRMKAQNSLGTAYSEAQSFTTPAEPDGWIFQDSGTDNWLTSVDFFDENNGFVCGDNTILKTSDGGITWNNVYPFSQIPWFNGHGIVMLNTNKIIAVGSEGLILSSDDGGNTWTQNQVGNSLHRAVSFFDISNGVVVNGGGEIFKTTDGGNSWTQLGSPVTSTLTAVTMLDVNTIIASGIDRWVIKSSNGGLTWNTQQVGDYSGWWGGISFADQNNGMIAIDGGYILKTTDSGTSWNQIFPGTGNFITVSMIDVNNAVIAGNMILRTQNGGITWIEEKTGTYNYTYGIKTLPTGETWAVGDYGLILKSTDYLSLTSPIGGESWQANAIHNINWYANGVENVKIEFTTDDGANWNEIAASVPANIGSYDWSIPNSPSSNCRVRISDINDPAIYDISDNLFSILPPPLITVDGIKDPFYNSLTGPDDGYLQIKHFSYNDNGKPDNDADLSAKVWAAWDEEWFYMYEEVLDDTISGNAQNVWEEDCSEIHFDAQPTDSLVNSMWSKRLTALAEGDEGVLAWDDLNGLSPDDKQFARTKTPSGYIAELAIKWSAIGHSTPETGESIMPAVNNIFGMAIMDHDNDGQAHREASVQWGAVIRDAVWNTPKYCGTVKFLSDHKLQFIPTNNMTGVTNPIPYDGSNFLLVTSPNGGEHLKVGTKKFINWLSDGVENIKIEFSSNNGSSWSEIISSTPATQFFEWTIPDIISNQCKIRITDVLNNQIYDVSNSFTIRPCGILTEVEPNNPLAQAMQVFLQDTLDASIDPIDDIDYYAFEGNQGDTIMIYAENRGVSELTAQLTLFDHNNILMDNSSFAGSSFRKRIVYVLPSSGTYYARFAYWGNPNSSSPSNNPQNQDLNRMKTLDLPAGASNDQGEYRIIFDYFKKSAPGSNYFYTTDISYNSARVSGSIYPNGLNTTITIEYGLTTSYGNSLIVTTSPNDLNDWYFDSQKITGLQANTQYYYRLTLENALGTFLGNENSFFTAPAPIGWVAQNSGTQNWLGSIDFLDLNTGVACGSPNIILKTTDAGNTWENICPPNPDPPFYGYAVDIISSNKIVAAGGNGLIFLTNDGGSNWDQIQLGNFYHRSVSFFDLNNGVVVNENGEIYKTTSGGNNWIQLTSPVTSGLFAVLMIDINTIIASGNDRTIIKSTDGGSTWITQQVGDHSSWWGAISFSDQNNGMVTNDNYLLYKTTDCGSTWMQLNPGTGNFCAVSMMDSAHALIAGSRIFRTNDGGLTWSQENTGTYNWLYGIKALPSGEAWAVGEWGTIIHTLPLEPVEPGIIAHYPFDGNANDTSGNGNNGNIIGGVSWGTNRFNEPNRAAQFNGIDGYIEVANSATLQSLVNALTITSWVYIEDFPGIEVAGIVMKTNSPTHGQYGLGYQEVMDPNGIFCAHNGNSDYFAQVKLDRNRWYFISSVYNGSGYTIYLDGNPLGFIPLSEPLIADNNPVTIGLESNGYSEFLQGKLDDIRIYNTVLSEAEIRTLYSEGGWSQQSITISSGGDSGELTFGFHPDATDGIDVSLGEQTLPPFPPSGVFDARFELPIIPIDHSLKDFRNDTVSSSEWLIRFQPGEAGYPILFSWDPMNLPAGSFYLKDPFTGTLVNVDMKTESSYNLTNPLINSLKIVYLCRVCGDIPLLSGWNILSAPVEGYDMQVENIFMNETSPVYGYNNGYFIEDTLKTSKGYWIRNSIEETINLCGSKVSLNYMPVNQGWNLVGPYDYDVPAASLTTTPSDILTSPFYGFRNGYYIADTLKEGTGYWIRCSQAGTINFGGALPKQSSPLLSSVKINDDWGRIVIRNTKHEEMVLYTVKEANEELSRYDLPPRPPAEIFDARYGSERYVELLGMKGKEISINTASYPVTIRAEKINIKIKDIADGSIVNKYLKEGEELEITNPAINRLRVMEEEIPLTYQLFQNYPNPFNPRTKIKFGIPEKAMVKLEVYNSLGERVDVLIDKEMDPGYYEAEFGSNSIASGVYFYRIQTPSFSQVKKMIMIK